MEITITCEERFDVWAIQRLRKALAQAKQTHNKLNFDLSEVRFLDNAAMSYLQELAQTFELEFVKVSPKAELIFDLTGFQLKKMRLAA